MKRIFALDPGNEQTAWCELVDGKPLGSDKVPNKELLLAIRNEGIVMADVFAIEMIASYGMAVGREVFETCVWIGRFQEAFEARGARVRLVFRKEVKLFLCESAKANDANIRAALIDRFGPGKDAAIGRKAAPGPLFGIKGDQWSALAVAVTVEGIPTPAPIFSAPAPAKPALEHGEMPF